jgi:cyclic-di-GMP-binding protein
MPDNSFDVASKIDLNEVLNAVQQTSKEIGTRYDLKDSKSSVELNEKDHKILLASSDEYKLKAVTEILGQKLVKRSVPLKGLEYSSITHASGGSVKQEITLQQGIST